MKHKARATEFGWKDEGFALVGQKLKEPEPPAEIISDQTPDFFEQIERDIEALGIGPNG